MATSRKDMELAYCQVNGITKAEVRQERHRHIITTALTDVWSYSGLYPGENDVLKRKRLDMETPSNGEVTELAKHFKEIYPEEFKNTTGWATIIFIMYNRLKGYKPEPRREASTEMFDSLDASEGQEPSDKNFINEKETETMITDAAKANLGGLNEIEEKLQANVETDITMETENLPDVGNMKATYEIAQRKYEEEQAERKAFSKQAKVTEIVFSKPPAKKIAVDGENAVGTLANVDKALADFCDKAKVEDDGAGNVMFHNVTPDTKENAKVMYQALKEAKTDGNKEFKVFISKSSGTIKGFKIVDNKGGAGVYKSVQETIDTIINKAYGVLYTTEPSVQLQLKKIDNKNKQADKGSGTVKVNDKKPRGYEGIASIRISDKTLALEKIPSFHKEIIKDKIDLLKGMKSEMFIKYYRDKQTKDTVAADEVKKGTWRIPLMVKQYTLEVVDGEKKAVFGEGQSSVGAVARAVDIDDEKAMEKMFKDISSIITAAAARGVYTPGSFMDKVRREATAKAAADAEAEAADVAGANL